LLSELEENLTALSKEEKINEKILAAYLKATISLRAKEKLKKILNDPAINIRFFAKRTLLELETN